MQSHNYNNILIQYISYDILDRAIFFKFRWGVPYGTQGLAPARKNMILVPVSFSY